MQSPSRSSRLLVFATLTLFGITHAPAGADAAGSFYTDESAFTLALQPSYYFDDFSGFSFGSPLDGQTSYVAPGANGYGWTATCADGLYSASRGISTSLANTTVVITFTSGNVTAIGGLVANSDFFGEPIAGSVTFTLSNGATRTISLAGGTNEGFLGYTSDVPITSVNLSSTSAAGGNYLLIDNFYTGTAVVPEPATWTLLAGALCTLTGLRWLRRR